MAKNLALGPILAHLAQIQVIKFFVSKIWLCQLQDVMVSYQSCRISIKTNDPILRKEGWRDGGRDRGQTDGQEWFHKMLSDLSPVSKNRNLMKKNLTLTITMTYKNSWQNLYLFSIFSFQFQKTYVLQSKYLT